MAKRWEDQLSDVSVKLDELSKKAAEASEKAQFARELKEEVRKNRIDTVKGDIAAFQDRVQQAENENRIKLSSTILKAQMTIKAKIQDKREARDQKLFESYIEDQIQYIYECFETADYMISNAQLAILETLDAAAEYNEKYGTAEEAAEEK